MIFLLTPADVLGLSCISGLSVFFELEIPNDKTSINTIMLFVYFHRKSTFDMFNFLASQHRQLPDIGPYDDEEDEVLLKSTRCGFTSLFSSAGISCVQMFKMSHFSLRRATSLELPMAMRFRHLERTSKEAVGVYRSDQHGQIKRPV